MNEETGKKQESLIKYREKSNDLHIWTEKELESKELESIKGIHSNYYHNSNLYIVSLDPRYDPEIVMQNVEEYLK